MKKIKLTWLDSLMIGVTFGEAGMDVPELQAGAKKKERRCECTGECIHFGPGRDKAVPAHS
jgi:hypothetical protein